jgi:general stress protein CsbA
MENKWTYRFSMIRFLGWVAIAGLVILFLAAVSQGSLGYLSTFLVVLGLLLFVPGFVYLYVIVILHWKDRYRGRHSDLWGVLILIETTGWMKLVYIFRHLLPDMNRSGRYRLVGASSEGLPIASPPKDGDEALA